MEHLPYYQFILEILVYSITLAAGFFTAVIV